MMRYILVRADFLSSSLQLSRRNARCNCFCLPGSSNRRARSNCASRTRWCRPDQLGKPAPVSPLVFTPPMEGQFVWLSSRSGTFAPKGVLPLGTKYQISLRAGLKDAAGRPVTATLKGNRGNSADAGERSLGARQSGRRTTRAAMPRYLILFNANVKAAALREILPVHQCVGRKDRSPSRTGGRRGESRSIFRAIPKR